MESNNTSSTKLDVYQIVADRIIELLEQGTIPWKQPWKEAGIPMNVISRRPYRGINLWLLLTLGYEQNLFLTWDQLKKIGGSVKQGEHGHIVIYWKTKKKEESQNVEVSEGETKDKKKEAPLLRYYKVFNVSQCRDLTENLTETSPAKTFNSIQECESIIYTMPNCPAIKHKDQKAFYHLLYDYINMPKKESFKSMETYYATLFHELVHSTGSEKRLNRASANDMAEFGSEFYSLEELIAELGSAFLCFHTGISPLTIDDSAAYINGWLSKLKNDKKFIVQASGMAQKAADFIMNIRDKNNSKSDVEQLGASEKE
jgi:antirestriction protein ArdC